MKIVKIVLGLVVMVVVIGFILLTTYVGNQVADGLLYMNRGKDTGVVSYYQLDEWAFDYKGFEASYKIEEITYDRVPIVTFGDLSKEVIILVHGLGGDYKTVYPQAKMYLEAGYSVVAYDQRGAGRSTMEEITFGCYESHDLKKVVEYVKEHSNSKVYIHGFSMGAATAGIYAASGHAKDHVAGIIMDSSIDSMKNMFLMVWHQMEVDAPDDYVVFAGNVILNIKHGFGFDDADVTKILRQVDLPVLLIHSKQDGLVSKETTRQMYDNIPHDKKEMWLVDAKHIEGFIDFPLEYKEKVVSFINGL